MDGVRNTLYDATKYYNLNKEQGNAYWDVLSAYQEAGSGRHPEVYSNSDMRDNSKDLENKALAAYKKLYEALNRPNVRNHLTDDAVQLRNNLD